jgi:hypothetical protein
LQFVLRVAESFYQCFGSTISLQSFIKVGYGSISPLLKTLYSVWASFRNLYCFKGWKLFPEPREGSEPGYPSNWVKGMYSNGIFPFFGFCFNWDSWYRKQFYQRNWVCCYQKLLTVFDILWWSRVAFLGTVQQYRLAINRCTCCRLLRGCNRVKQ